MTEFKSLETLTVEMFANKYGKLMYGKSDKCKSGFYLVANGTEAHPEQTTVFVSTKVDPKRTVVISYNQYDDNKEGWCLQNARELADFNANELESLLAQ